MFNKIRFYWFTCTDKQTVSKPRLEEPVIVSLVDMDVATEDQLYITRIVQEDNEPGSNP